MDKAEKVFEKIAISGKILDTAMLNRLGKIIDLKRAGKIKEVDELAKKTDKQLSRMIQSREEVVNPYMKARKALDI